jgi:hypothetical protein
MIGTRTSGRPSREKEAVMEFTIDLQFVGWLILIGGALAFGLLMQFIGEARTGFEWLVVAIAAFAGGLVVSEFVIASQTFGPVYEGLALVPALIGGLIFGLVADMVTRFVTGGTYFHRAVSA